MRTDTPVPSNHTRRLVNTAFGWYAMTREQSDPGPFTSQQEASREPDLLIPHHRRYRVVVALSVFVVGLMAVSWVSSL